MSLTELISQNCKELKIHRARPVTAYQTRANELIIRFVGVSKDGEEEFTVRAISDAPLEFEVLNA